MEIPETEILLSMRDAEIMHSGQPLTTRRLAVILQSANEMTFLRPLQSKVFGLTCFYMRHQIDAKD